MTSPPARDGGTAAAARGSSAGHGTTPRGPSPNQRSGQLLRQAAHSLDEAVHNLSGPVAQQDVPAALACISEVRRALANLARPPDPHPDKAPRLLRRLELPPTPDSPRAARATCRETCDEWELPHVVGSAVADLASELVGNACRHGTGPVVVALELSGSTLTISVFDDGPGRPGLLPYRPGVSERGLGLHLVQHLSEEWGWTDDGPGKWVWARVHVGDTAADVLDRRPSAPRG